VPPATPTAAMTVARMTRRRPPRVHDDDLSFLNNFIRSPETTISNQSHSTNMNIVKASAMKLVNVKPP
jgi:hypothetical protein